MAENIQLPFVQSSNLEAQQQIDALRSVVRDINRILDDLEASLQARDNASVSVYTAARDAAPNDDWENDAPTTVKDALDRFAYHVANGFGAVPIKELP